MIWIWEKLKVSLKTNKQTFESTELCSLKIMMADTFPEKCYFIYDIMKKARKLNFNNKKKSLPSHVSQN